MKVQYSCHVLVSADRETLDQIKRDFEQDILQPIGDVNVDDRGA